MFATRYFCSCRIFLSFKIFHKAAKNDDDICLIVENEKGIEISDSDDEDDGIKSKRSDEMQNINTVEMNDSATENQNEPTNRNDEAPLKLMELKIVLHQCNDGSVMESGDSNDENSNSSIVVKDVNSPGDQLMESIDENDECFKLNAPMNVEIDCSSNEVELMNEAENNPPIALKSSQETDHSCTENGQTKQQANSLTMASNQSKRITNRFKYVPRDSSSRIKGKLKQYQRVRANGKLIGASSNSNGLHQCTLCARRFTDMHHLSRHMKAHNDGQYMYDCAPCMWQFVEEVRKDWHESQWNGRHYKCYLCKAYVTPFKFDMYRHMQTHTGAFRF